MKSSRRSSRLFLIRLLSIRKLTALGVASLLLVAGAQASPRIVLVAGGSEDAVNISAKSAKLKEPFGTDFDAAGNMWIVEMVSGNRLLKVDASGVLSHVAGLAQPGFSGDGGPALEAKFNGPHNLAVLPKGNILIADTWNGRVREIDVASGRVDAVAGYEVAFEKARGNGPYCITLDFTGTKLYIADLRSVHVLDLATHKLSLVAGNGEKGVPADGAVAPNLFFLRGSGVAPRAGLGGADSGTGKHAGEGMGIGHSSGYSGGKELNPTYEQICAKVTGHAEVIKIEFDPAVVTLEKLLDFFWQVHNPTQVGGQGNDHGPQYRSIILFADAAQKVAAEKSQAAAMSALAAIASGWLANRRFISAGAFKCRSALAASR
jgi:methionine-S-sulfoxide reductase